MQPLGCQRAGRPLPRRPAAIGYNERMRIATALRIGSSGGAAAVLVGALVLVACSGASSTLPIGGGDAGKSSSSGGGSGGGSGGSSGSASGSGSGSGSGGTSGGSSGSASSSGGSSSSGSSSGGTTSSSSGSGGGSGGSSGGTGSSSGGGAHGPDCPTTQCTGSDKCCDNPGGGPPSCSASCSSDDTLECLKASDCTGATDCCATVVLNGGNFPTCDQKSTSTKCMANCMTDIQLYCGTSSATTTDTFHLCSSGSDCSDDPAQPNCCLINGNGTYACVDNATKTGGMLNCN
jgi:hypothetical protein